ncbi:Glycosyltransferase involved in cell wall bisynthesis [Lachnospiraceae bacterium]|nr:Glycosyltransferase involved in cell wall bisynthesis [Lachnospiraceae bacterium]
MKVLFVNNCDLPGRVFNGYDLHNALIKKGITANLVVIDKFSDDVTVKQLEIDALERELIIYEEEKNCLKNLLFPYAEKLFNLKLFKEADIVHFHFPYHDMFSLLDYKLIMDRRAVWTIHDMWPVTGNCTNPFECRKWISGCGDCQRYDDDYFPMKMDNTAFMWKIKKEAYKDINPHIIVSTKNMESIIRKSPLTGHFNDINVIPFGISFCDRKKEKRNKIVIGFRLTDAKIKGCQFLYQAIRKLKGYESKIEFQCVDEGHIPDDIEKRFVIKKYGWVHDKNKLNEIMYGWDIFVMPSINESFGIMAIEAMGSKCALLCFKDTIIEELAEAPENALTAAYKDEDDLFNKLKLLIDSKRIREDYQRKGFIHVRNKYSFDTYVDRHIALYDQIMRG